MSERPSKTMDEVIRDDGRYPPEAYEFLPEGIASAVKGIHGTSLPQTAEEAAANQSHVTGSQLCIAMRDLARDRWGMLAKAVLERWNIRETIDFGNMVYLLIRYNYMRKTEDDSIEDFRAVYDFNDAFDGADHFELTE